MTDRPPRRTAVVRRLWLVLAIAFGGVLLVPSAAQATPFPETWLADGNVHTYCFDASFTAANRPVGTNAMNVLGNTTDFSVSQDAACIAGSDVKWFQVNLPAGTRGQAQCMAFHPNGTCSTNDVRIDFPEIDIGVNDAQDREKTAVHEVGHTVGLGHHSPAAHDCAMVSGELPSLDIKWRRYHAHDISHINAAY